MRENKLDGERRRRLVDWRRLVIWNGSLTMSFLIAMPAVVVRQRKAWRRRDGVFLYFEVRRNSRLPSAGIT